MSNLLATLKMKKVWIPLSIFIVLFLCIAAGSYFIAKAVTETVEDTPAFPVSEIAIAAIDPDKRQHLSKAEIAYFDAERYASLRKYTRARDSFADCADQFAAAMGTDSSVVCMMLIRQAEFESKWGKFDEAEAVLKRALANLPRGEKGANLSFTVNRWLGYVLQRHQKYSEALAVLTANVEAGQKLDQSKHITGQPNHRLALASLSSCYAAAKQFDKASQTSQELLSIVEKLSDNKDMLVDTLIELGRIETYSEKYMQAIGYYNKALAIDSKSTKALRARAIAFDSLKQYRNAISDFTLIIQIDPKDQNAYEWRGYDYDMNGESDRAIADLSKAIELDDHDSAAFDSRARLLFAAKRYKEAVSDYTASIELDDSPWTYLYRGEAYAELARHEEAIADYTRALKSNYFVTHPNRKTNGQGVTAAPRTMGALVYKQRAKSYRALGKADLAAADIKMATSLDASRPKVDDKQQ